MAIPDTMLKRVVTEGASAVRALSPRPVPELTAAELDALVGRVASVRLESDRQARLCAVASALESDRARHLAYKVSMATAMADLASSDEEFEFDLALLDALQLPNALADRLAGEVHEALTAEG
jgi:hypothetical protein